MGERMKRIEAFHRKLNMSELNNPFSEFDAPHAVGIGFVDAYRYAMHTLGFQYLYHRINQEPDFAGLRFYLPPMDIQKACEESGTYLLTQECNREVRSLGLLFLSVNYEPNLLNLFRMLELAGIPFAPEQREQAIIVGGIAPSYNPRLYAAFADAVVLGEAENAMGGMLDAYRGAEGKDAFLAALAGIPGVYVYSHHGDMKRCRAPIADIHEPSFETIVSSETKYPNCAFVEVARGCHNHCRFCILGTIFRRMRFVDADHILSMATRLREHTDSIRLIAAAENEHPEIDRIYAGLRDLGFSFVVKSLRADLLDDRLMDFYHDIGLDAMTIAPEAGDDELRGYINKSITDDEIMRTVEGVKRHGIRKLTLYMIIGFTTDYEQELDSIIGLVDRILASLKESSHDHVLDICLNSHIKKPHTMFETDPQIPLDTYRDAIDAMRERYRGEGNVSVCGIDLFLYALEAIMVRGEADDLRKVHDFWKANRVDLDIEHLRLFFDDELDSYFHGKRILHWKQFDMGVTDGHIQREAERAKDGVETPSCMKACSACGACPTADHHACH